MGMMERSKRKNADALAAVLKRCLPKDRVWLVCKTCGREWPRLSPSGLCIECEEGQ